MAPCLNSSAAILSRNFGNGTVGGLEYCDLSNETDVVMIPNYAIVLGVNEYVRIAMYVVIFIVCVVGNALVIVTLLQNRKMRTVTNIFLINLSVGDLLLGVFCMPVTLTGQILHRFIFGAAMCKMIPYFQVVSVAVSTFTLVSISTERFFAICYPLTSRRWQTVSHSIKMTILCWILAFVVAFPVLVYSSHYQYDTYQGVDYYACREIYPSEELGLAYNMILFCLLFGLPGVFMTLAYVKITLSLYKGIKTDSHTTAKETSSTFSSVTNATNGSFAKFGSKFARFRAGSSGLTKQETRNGSTSGLPRSATLDEMECMSTMTSPGQQYPQTPSPNQGVRSTHTERNLQAKKRVILMLIIVVLEFFVCFTPLWLVNIIGSFAPQNFKHSNWGVAITYLQLLMYVSTCCNPITYCFLHSKFRQGFIQAFKCTKNKPEITDLMRIRTTRPISYRRNERSSMSTGSTVTTCKTFVGQRVTPTDAYL